MKVIQINKDILYRLYIVENKTMTEIASIFKCDRNYIGKELKKHNIRSRWYSQQFEKDLLWQLHVEEDKSVGAIAKILNVSRDTIVKNLNKNKIPIKNHNKANKIILNKQDLVELHVNQDKSVAEIARILNVCDSIVKKYLIQYNIQFKNHEEKRKVNIEKKDLIDLYVIQNKTLKEIGKIFNCSYSAISCQLKKYNIKTRPGGFANVYKRFNDNIKILDSGCWEWQGKPSHGYGIIVNNGKAILAHVFSWEFYNNTQINNGDVIHHKCHNTLCVNPEHLERMTIQQHNVLHNNKRQSSLSINDVKNIKIACLNDNIVDKHILYKQLSIQYSVSYQTIERIDKHKTWKNIK